MRSIHRGLALAAILTCLPAALAAAESAGPSRRVTLRGRPLAEALKIFQEEGLRLVFSSAVVDERALVTVEPREGEPRERLEEILAPLGLQTREGPGGTILIVRAGGEAGTGTLRGRVLSMARGAPVAGATIRVLDMQEAVSARADGTFEIRAVPVGAHDLVVEATGFVSRTLTAVPVNPRRTPALTVTLEALPTYLEEIIVTPSRLSVLQEEQNPDLTVSGGDAVLVPTFGGDVSRLVELLPGVAAPDNSAAFHVRGSEPEDLAIMLDGVELYDPFHLKQFQSPFSILDANIVERIDFVGGAFTAEFGDRHGGVIRVDTWVPQGPHTTRVGVGTLNSRIAHGGQSPGGSASWLVSARTWYPETLRSTIELGESELDPRFGDAYLRFSYNASPRTVLSAHALASYDQLEFEESDGAETVDASSRNGYVWLRGLRTWPRGVVTDTVLSAGRFERGRRGLSEPETQVLKVVDDREVNLLGLRHDTTWQVSSSHLLKAGFEVRGLTSEYEYVSGPANDVTMQTMRKLNPSGTSLSGYTSYRAGLASSLAVELGLRFDRQAYTQESQISPRFNAVLRPGPRSELRLGWGRYYQSQRIHELRIEDGETDFLPAELSRQAGLTWQQQLPGEVSFRLDAYYRKLSSLRPRSENLFNPIELYPETEMDRVTVSPRRARLRGAELLLHTSSASPFNGWISYAWSSAQDVIDGKGVPRSWDQTHAVRFLAGYRAPNRWSLALSGLGHTGWPTTPMTATATPLPGGGFQIDPVLGERNSVRFGRYLRLDLKAIRSFTLPGGRLTLDLEVQNLTDRENACCVDDFIFRARPNGTVDVDREEKFWLGLTPAFRLVYEF